VQKSIGRRLARTFEDELGDVGKAEETYKYVLGVDPADADALANLDRIYVSIEGWKDLAQILEMRVQATTDNLELVELFARLGELYEQRLGDVPSAIRAYRASSTASTRRTRARSPRSLASTSSKARGRSSTPSTRGELENAPGDSAEADIRAKIAPSRPRSSANPSARSTRGKPCSTCAAKTPRRCTR
jgi:golgin subfamily B member 1